MMQIIIIMIMIIPLIVTLNFMRSWEDFFFPPKFQFYFLHSQFKCLIMNTENLIIGWNANNEYLWNKQIDWQYFCFFLKIWKFFYMQSLNLTKWKWELKDYCLSLNEKVKSKCKLKFKLKLLSNFNFAFLHFQFTKCFKSFIDGHFVFQSKVYSLLMISEQKISKDTYWLSIENWRVTEKKFKPKTISTCNIEI